MHSRFCSGMVRFLTATMAVSILPGCPGIPGNGGNHDGDCEAEFTAVAADEPWFLVTDSTVTEQGLTYFTMSGMGTGVDQVSLLAPPYEGTGCATASATAASDDSDGLGTLTIDGQRLRIRVQVPARNGETTCAFNFEAVLERCGKRETFVPLNTFDAVPGAAELDGEPVNLAEIQLLRFRQPQPDACADPLTSLPEEWTLSNVNPIENLAPMPRPDAVVATASGMGEIINTVDITGSSISCFADAGTITFDGTTLSIDVPEGDFNQPPQPEPIEPPAPGQVMPPETQGGCSMQFTGTVADCDFFVLTFAGVGPVAFEILRIEGEGAYSRGDVTGTLDTMYLYRREGGENLCGIGMIFALPMGLLGLTALRTTRRIGKPLPGITQTACFPK